MRIFRRPIFKISLVTVFVILILAGIVLAQKTPHNPCQAGGYTGPVYAVGRDGVTAPRIIRTVEPEYTENARRAEVEGAVLVAFIVNASGNPTTIRVCEGLGSGLDEKATEAVRQWKFEPGTLHGKTVPVETTVEVAFHLHK